MRANGKGKEGKVEELKSVTGGGGEEGGKDESVAGERERKIVAGGWGLRSWEGVRN